MNDALSSPGALSSSRSAAVADEALVNAQEAENANDHSKATFDAADALDATMRQMADKAKQLRK